MAEPAVWALTELVIDPSPVTQLVIYEDRVQLAPLSIMDRYTVPSNRSISG